MKTLFLLRHAKAEKEIAGKEDFNRDLTERGMRNAHAMARKSGIDKNHLDLILSSPANRTIQTTRIFAENLEIPNEKIFENLSIYQADVDTLYDLILILPEDINTAMLVGHNPGVAMLIGMLTGKMPEKVPTCTLAAIQFPVNSWSQISHGSGRLFLFEYPEKD